VERAESAIVLLAAARVAEDPALRVAQRHQDEAHWRGACEPQYDRVYGSAVFSSSAERVARFKQHFPEAVVGYLEHAPLTPAGVGAAMRALAA
jgi:hypothetical protein